MAAPKRWKFSAASEEIPVVTFENGSIKHNRKLPIRVYTSTKKENADKKYPAKIKLSTNIDGMEYVGTNNDKINKELHRTILAVEDINTGEVTFYPTTSIVMKPQIVCNTYGNEVTTTDEKSARRVRAQELNKEFGSQRRRHRLLVSQKLELSSEDTAAAAKTALGEAEAPDIGKLSQNANANQSTIIPPRNDNATAVNEVYDLDDIIEPSLYEILDSLAVPLSEATSQDVETWKAEKTYPTYVLSRILFLSEEPEVRAFQLRLLVTYCQLIECYNLNGNKLRRKDPLEKIPDPLKSHLLNKFTVSVFNARGKPTRLFPDSMKQKVLAYLLVVVLFLEEFRFDLSILQVDTGIATMQKLASMASALGCYVNAAKDSTTGDTTKEAHLKLPLPRPSSFNRSRRSVL